MKAFTSLALTALGLVTLFVPILATKDESTTKHHSHSVHSTKTHHRAKTTLIPQSMVPAHPSSTCTSVPAGAKETPAHREPGASIIFRASCGITHETVKECPFLCGPGGEGSFKACFSEDVSQSKLPKDPEQRLPHQAAHLSQREKLIHRLSKIRATVFFTALSVASPTRP
ncbi:MAG: hypothetical protein Q9164_000991 [Protoblastenia rupestris]